MITIINALLRYLKDLKKKKYVGSMDMGDLGNEIGYFIAEYLNKIAGNDITDFISGLYHGVDLYRHDKEDKKDEDRDIE